MKSQILRMGQVCLLFVCIQCGQSYNSDSQDKQLAALEGGSTNATISASTKASIAILKTNCMACHSNWSSYTTDKSWSSSELVTSGDANNSQLISILINNGGSMPKDGDALSQSDYDTLVNWINGMQ
ncbi:MAG: cytochrome c [Oligoflexales bacterium]|nr:cytochrome c [Oligoflexales bacterium]